MAKDRASGRLGADAPPREFPSTTPPLSHTVDHSFTLQSIMEVQKSIGKLTEAVESLKEESKGQRKELNILNRGLWVAGAVLMVAGLIGGFVLNNMGNKMLTLLQNVDKLMALVK